MAEKQLFGPCKACGAYFDSRENAEKHVIAELGKTGLAKRETRIKPSKAEIQTYQPKTSIGRKLQKGMQKVKTGVDTLGDVSNVINQNFNFDAALGDFSGFRRKKSDAE